MHIIQPLVPSGNVSCPKTEKPKNQIPKNDIQKNEKPKKQKTEVNEQKTSKMCRYVEIRHMDFRCFYNNLVIFVECADSKSIYLEIDASSDANSFEIGKLRLSAFQNGTFR